MIDLTKSMLHYFYVAIFLFTMEVLDGFGVGVGANFGGVERVVVGEMGEGGDLGKK